MQFLTYLLLRLHQREMHNGVTHIPIDKVGLVITPELNKVEMCNPPIKVDTEDSSRMTRDGCSDHYGESRNEKEERG
jgi:hypothetical protein